MKRPLFQKLRKRWQLLGLSTFGLMIPLVPLVFSACAANGLKQVSGYVLPDRLPGDTEFTLLSWNVHKGKNPDMPEDLFQAVQAYQPELLFLQEAKPGTQEAPHVAGGLGAAWRDPFEENSEVGVFTASSITPIEQRVFVSKSRELGFTFPKAAMMSRVPLPDGRELLAVNVHALNFEHGQPKRFARQMQVLHTLMAAHKGPILFAGDFNTWNRERVNHMRELATELGMKEVVDFGGKRKTGDQGWANALIGIDPTLPLDRVFYRGLELTRAEILPLDSSDHQPLLVSFRVSSLL